MSVGPRNADSTTGRRGGRCRIGQASERFDGPARAPIAAIRATGTALMKAGVEQGAANALASYTANRDPADYPVKQRDLARSRLSR
jgi:hypothetical protein